MSTFVCEVIEIRGFGDHPDAHSLQITEAFGNPVVIAKDSFKRGDKAVYIPIDSLVPVSRPEFAFLKKDDKHEYERIKAKRLRGFYSEGLLVPAKPEWQVGFDATAELGVKKYEEQIVYVDGENEKDPGFMPKFDLEPYLKYRNVLEPGERVVVTEKIHGMNFRVGVKDGEVSVGSHNMIKRFNEKNQFWATALKYGLDKKLLALGHNGIVVYGEVFGQVQDLRYGRGVGERDLALFAAYDSVSRKWLDYDDFVELAKRLDVPVTPVLYDGPYDHDTVHALRLGKTTAGGDHIREGVVITPALERVHPKVGRVSLKDVSEDYKTRKKGTEYH